MSPSFRVAALFVLSVVVALLGAEALLRAIRFAGPTGMFRVTDSVNGFRLRPGLRSWYNGEGESFFTVNSDGMPDSERVVAKPAEVFRIAVVGDSFTEGAMVPREERFTAVIERTLGHCPALGGKHPEVLAFGTSGYGTGQELMEIRSHVWKYLPDLVLLQLFPGNDLHNNVQELNIGEDPGPYFIFVNGVLELVPFSVPAPVPEGRLQFETRLYNNVRLLHLIQKARYRWRNRHKVTGVNPNARTDTFGMEPGISWQIFLPPQTPPWTQAWVVTEGLLRTMQQEASSHHASFHVAVFPSAIQVHPDRAKREAFRAGIGAKSLSYSEDRLAEMAARDGIDLLNLAPPMLAEAEARQIALYGFQNAVPGLGHWNEEGHRVGGEAIARWLCK